MIKNIFNYLVNVKETTHIKTVEKMI